MELWEVKEFYIESQNDIQGWKYVDKFVDFPSLIHTVFIKFTNGLTFAFEIPQHLYKYIGFYQVGFNTAPLLSPQTWDFIRQAVLKMYEERQSKIDRRRHIYTEFMKSLPRDYVLKNAHLDLGIPFFMHFVDYANMFDMILLQEEGFIEYLPDYPPKPDMPEWELKQFHPSAYRFTLKALAVSLHAWNFVYNGAWDESEAFDYRHSSHYGKVR